MAEISRRSFLKAAATSGVLAATAGLAATQAFAEGSASGSASTSGSAAASGSASGSAAASGSVSGSAASGSASGSTSAAPSFTYDSGENIVVPASFTFQYFPPVAGTVAYEEAPVADADIAQTLDCDVVVCGAGLAGASAALSCAENGLTTIVLEKGDTPAGRGAQLGAIGSQVQAAAGTDAIDITEWVNDGVASMGFRVKRAIWQRYANNCGAAADWLIDKLAGACGEWSADSPHNVVNSGVTSWGDTIRPENGMPTVTPAIIDAATALGADVHYDTPAVQLVQADDGSIAGVIAKGADGSYLKINAAKGVILATGGYENNWDMMCKSLEPRDLTVAAWRNSTTTNTGDGHLMGMAVGGAIDDYPHVIMNDPGASVKSHTFCRPLAQPFLRINSLGRRFVNEAASPELVSAAISVQPGAHCFVVIAGDLTQNITTLFANRNLPWKAEDMVPLLEPEVTECDTVDDLAAFIGCDVDTLQDTLDTYNAAYDAQEDARFGKSANALLPVADAPYYVCEEGSAALVTVSGLKVGYYSNVIDETGASIPGLFALGNVSGGMFDSYYPHHLQANSHGRCVTFGYLLGRHLAGIDEDPASAAAAGSAAASGSASGSTSGSASASGSTSGSASASSSAAAGSAAAGSYKDGTYTGTGTGMGGKINVTLQISGGKITVTDISPNNETKGIGGYEAIQDGTFKSQIEAAQSADIEDVSGASVTSAAIKKAVADALAQAAA